MQKHWIPLLSVLYLSSACSDGDGGRDWAGTIATLANGTVVVSNPYGPIWGEGDAWTVTEELRIGAVEGEGPDVFGELKTFVVDAGGRMYILDRHAHEIRVIRGKRFYAVTRDELDVQYLVRARIND